MRWDFSLWQQAEDRWQSMRDAAEEQRHLGRVQSVRRTPRLYVLRRSITRVGTGHPADLVRRWFKGAA